MKLFRNLKRNIVSLTLVCALALSGISVMPASEVTAASVPSSINFVQNDDTTCTITWNAVSGASSYDVYKAESRYAAYNKIDTVSGTSYTDTDYAGQYYKVAVSGSKELSAATSYEIATFGYDTYIFEETDNNSEIQSVINSVYKSTEAGQFISDRQAFLFAPGTYSNNLLVDIGFYTQVAGMGVSPKDTVVGNIRVKAEWMKGIKSDGSINYSALCNFWRSVENLTTTADSTMWAVSQATSMRRMNILGSLDLHQQGGYASGGFLADTKVTGRKYTYTDNRTGKKVDAQAGISAGSQQQWLTRNTEMNAWDGNVWNYVFVGCEISSLYGTDATPKNGPDGEWPYAQYTKITNTPKIQEKPFLTVDNQGNYGVFVPELRTNASGVSWDGEEIKGDTISLDDFYVAKPTDTAAKINAEIKEGKNLILTPGIYSLSEPIVINNENTIVLGLGYATLKPTKGNQCMTVGNVGGVKIAGVLFDAGSVKSQALLTVGTQGNKTSHADNPIALCDTFYRVGGADTNPGKTTNCVIINSSDVIGDNFWVWRADHGLGVGWTKNTSDTGLIVNGNNVITYGLMVEHFQKYQTMWNGNGGKCYMYQSELPYDIPSQSVWNAPGSYGYADYKVASNVTSHEGYGIGIYSCYQKETCFLKSAVECPDVPGVKFTNVCTYSLSGNGGIDYVINKSGYGVYVNGDMSKVMSYSNGKYTQDRTYESARKVIWGALITEPKDAVYTGKEIKPVITVTWRGIKLREGIDYTITYKNNKAIGKAKVIVRGINAYKDSTTLKFKIIPAKTKIIKKKATKKKIKISYKKVKGANGYQVVYSQKKNFKKKKKINTKKTKVTIKRKSKGAYYVKVRAYKKVKKKYTYGKYSKKVKIKKVK